MEIDFKKLKLDNLDNFELAWGKLSPFCFFWGRGRGRSSAWAPSRQCEFPKWPKAYGPWGPWAHRPEILKIGVMGPMGPSTYVPMGFMGPWAHGLENEKTGVLGPTGHRPMCLWALWGPWAHGPETEKTGGWTAGQVIASGCSCRNHV